MAEKSTGAASRTGLVIGEVLNRKDDPTQTGQCKVRWNLGQVAQSEFSEDDIPWSKSLMSRHSASIKGVGGPHTGYLEGSKVYGLSISGDGQDMVILGSVPSGGKGDVDTQPQYDSDIPQPAKVQSNGQGGGNQPRYGDKNGVVEEYKDESVIKYAQDKGGPEKNPAKYPDLDDSAGTVGGSDGPDGAAKNDLIEV
jgi:hypothetical protein